MYLLSFYEVIISKNCDGNYGLVFLSRVDNDMFYLSFMPKNEYPAGTYLPTYR